MPKLRFAVIAFAIGFSTTAFAQALTAEQRTACKADYDKYCTGTMPGGGRIIACLNKQHDQLSDACKKVLDARKK
jgi:Cysteine rich repeat